MPPRSWTRHSWTRSSSPRRSYQASVLVVPLDAEARATLADLEPETLDGISVAGEKLFSHHQGFQPPRRVGTAGGVPTDSGARTGGGDEAGGARSSRLERAVHNSDIVVLLTRELAAVNISRVVDVADAARGSGRLLGAVVINPQPRWAGAAENHAAAMLREAVDNLVVVGDLGLVTGFLQVLRGGTRHEHPSLGEVSR